MVRSKQEPCLLRTIHTPTQGKSIKLIEIINHFPYNVTFLLYFNVFYYISILFITELHIRPHLPRFYHNNTLLYCILSFNNS